MQRSPKLDRLKSTKYKRALFVFFAGLRLQRREFGASSWSSFQTVRETPRHAFFHAGILLRSFVEGVELTSFFFRHQSISRLSILLFLRLRRDRCRIILMMIEILQGFVISVRFSEFLSMGGRLNGSNE